MARYTLNTDRKGKHIVKYQCGHCQSPLESPLDEAGQVFDCPTCGTKVQTPGVTELEQRRIAERRLKQLQEQSREEEVKRQQAILAEQAKARAAAESRAQMERDARATIQTATRPLWQLSLAFIFTLLASLPLFYFVTVWPLETRLRDASMDLVKTRAKLNDTADALAALTQTMNHNADAANANTKGLESLARTVSQNANALDSLTETVNHNAQVQNYNNSLR